MVCYALLCVFSRFALILMLASATSMWERRLDLKFYVFLLTIPWRCFFCGSFLLLMLRVCHAILSSIYCSLVVTCLERADLLALLYVVIYCVLSLPHKGVLGQMWYLSVLVADLCILSYFKERKKNNFVFQTVTQELLLGSYT